MGLNPHVLNFFFMRQPFKIKPFYIQRRVPCISHQRASLSSYEQSGLSLNNSFDCAQQMNCNADASVMEVVVTLQFNVVFHIFVG